MKKLLALLMVFCLCLPVAAAFAEAAEGSIVYASDFFGDEDGWYARSAGSAKLSRAPSGLFITGRDADWNSPGRDFTLTPGATYYFQCDVMQTGAESADFILSIAHTRDGVESYENLGRATVGRTKWTTITGAWTADAYDKYTLYIETSGSPKLAFTIRNFRVLLSDPGEQGEEPAPAREVPSLREKYADRFEFGACVNPADLRSRERRALILSQFSIITPENELKPDAVLDVSTSKRLAAEDDTAAAVRFDSVKPTLNFARDNGLKLHGHVLVWHSQTPEAFFHVGYDVKQPFVTREVMLARLDNYIRQVMAFMDENYPGLIVSWDVVNEAVADGSTRLRSSNWTRVVGEDFVNRAFEIADKYAPEDVLLYYNDYSTPYEPKTTGIVKLLTSLAEEGHIDGYGFQCHYQSGEPAVSKVRSAMDRVAALGLKLRVSELDVAVKADTESARNAQARYYGDLMALYLSYPQMQAVQVWGVNDTSSWIREKYPLLFDARLQPKPSFWALADLELE